MFNALLLASLIYGCEPDISVCQEERKERYEQLLDNMHLDCHGDTTTAFLKAVVNGEELCYYDGLGERYFKFGVTTIFTTPGPSFTIGDTISGLRSGAWLRFPTLDSNRHHEDYLDIQFPEFRFEMDPVAYLDSILAIKTHPIGSAFDDIRKFRIGLRLMYINITKHGRGPLPYTLTSKAGDQDGGYLKVVSVVKRKVFEHVEYDVVFEFQCKLYHDPNYCHYGLWGEVKEGRFEGTLRVRG